MKVVALGMALLFCLTSFQPYDETEGLCKKNEEVIYTFKLIDSLKAIYICKNKKNQYLVYRFGTDKRIEFEYPGKLDSSSWKAFELYGVKRFGGKANAGFGDYSLSFHNDGVKYEVYERWSDEEESQETGVRVTANGKETILKGNLKSQKGSLLRLDDESDRVENRAGEEE
ncbi:hypothetical protein GCM10023188_24780 [Pontibacter saemangeumensis]|uniref:Uncharacterized protein n=1 Tax=Pontibacter saemangeumensis TaxID=1084525 RepID=A0ABP8LQF2_9BACT